jgi:hypothetical protein
VVVAAAVVAADILSFHFLFQLVFLFFFIASYLHPANFIRTPKKKCLHATSASYGRPSHVSSNYYIHVLILLRICPHTAIASTCPHTTIYTYMSSYHNLCVLILLCYLFTCPFPLSDHTRPPSSSSKGLARA